jgi:hypothetical protein
LFRIGWRALIKRHYYSMPQWSNQMSTTWEPSFWELDWRRVLETALGETSQSDTEVHSQSTSGERVQLQRCPLMKLMQLGFNQGSCSFLSLFGIRHQIKQILILRKSSLSCKGKFTAISNILKTLCELYRMPLINYKILKLKQLLLNI